MPPQPHLSSPPCLRAFVPSCLLLLLLPLPLAAHETDQYTLPPPDREFADLGPQFSRWIHRVLERGVEKTNDRIKDSIDSKSNPSEIESLQSPDEIAHAVNRQFPWAMDVIEGLDRLVQSEKMKQRYPGRVVGYREPLDNVYQGAHLPIDPRQIFRLWLGCTMKVYGVYMGTDKFGHFTDMGMNYYRDYSKALHDGKSEPDAIRHAVHLGTNGLIFSERGMLGYMTAGAYSNGDLAANYVGLLFYINLTRPVLLQGQTRPPLLVHDGPYWKLAPHVTRDSDFFALFISDHLNEALNPSLREKGMREHFRKAIQARTHLILPRYRDEAGRLRPKEWYEQKAKDLMTYHGQDYSHDGTLDQLLPISSVCFDSSTANQSPRPLYLAAANPPPQPNPDAQTPLHRAAAAANTAAAAELLNNSANVNARDRFNTTPLHLAAAGKNPAIVKLLLDHHADVSAKDDFGVTPLHDAARAGSDPIVLLLLQAGADINARDAYGNTPLHLACRYNRESLAPLLIQKNADLHAANAAGSTPLHESAFAGDRAITQLLIQQGANQQARNQNGATPAQVASARGYNRLLNLLKNK